MLSQGFCFSSLLFLVRVHITRFAETLCVVGHISVLTIYGGLGVSSNLMVAGPAISFGVVVLLGVCALKFDRPPLSFGLFNRWLDIESNVANSFVNSDHGLFFRYRFLDCEVFGAVA